MRNRTCRFLALAALVAAGPAAAADLVQTARQRGDLDVFVDALQAAGVADEMRELDGPFTVFAPTDEAFRRLPDQLRARLFAPANAEKLERVLGLHVAPGGAHEADDIPVELDPLAEGRLVVTYTHGGLTLRPALAGEARDLPRTKRSRRRLEARVVDGDIRADNGMIHTIDAVLLPLDLGPLAAAGAAEGGTGGDAGGGTRVAVSSDAPAPRPERTGDRLGEPQALDEVIVQPPDPAPEREMEVQLDRPSEPTRGRAKRERKSEAVPMTADAPEPEGRAPRKSSGREAPETDDGADAPAAASTPPAPAGAAGEARSEGPPAIALTTSLISARGLLGREVRSSDGERVGEVQDLRLSLRTARVAEIVISIDAGFLDLFDREAAVPAEAVSINPLDGALQVDRSAADLGGSGGE